MDIIVSARHMDLTDAMRNSVISSLESLNHTGNINKAEVVLDSDHKKFRAEIIIHGSHLNLDAKAETGNMYESIDKAVERLQIQINKKFDKNHSSHKAQHLGVIEAKYAEEKALAEEEY